MSSRAVNLWHVKDENNMSNHQAFQVNEPSFYDEGYKTNNIDKFF